MRRLPACLLGLLLAFAALGPPHALADDVPPKQRAFVELTASRDEVFVGEPFTLRLRFGLDTAWFEEFAVELVRQRTELPIQVLAPALVGLDGAERRADRHADGLNDPQPPAGKRFVQNDGIGHATEVAAVDRNGRATSVYEVVVELVATRPGDLVVPPAVLRFAYATRFERDFARGRLPMDRTDVRVASAAAKVRVLPLPEEGRPAGFSGAVGRFTVTTALDSAPPAGQRGLRLVMRIEGEGNLERFDTPPLLDLDGFHVLGALDDRGRAVRTIRYDLEPVREGMAEVPSVALVMFDPGPPPAYRTVRAAAIPLATPLPAARSPDAATPNGRGEDGTKGRGSSIGGAWGALLGAALVLGLVAIAIALGRRKRARVAVETDPVAHRLRAALATLRSVASHPGADPTEAFADVLAARLDCTTPAVISPDLAARLAAAGVPRDLAAQAAGLVEHRVASRYGGQGEDAQADEIVAVAERVAASPVPTSSPREGG